MSPEDFKHLRRNKLGLTQKELAKVLCVPRVHVQRLEESRAPAIPGLTATAMRALEAGYRPSSWPRRINRNSPWAKLIDDREAELR